MARAEGFEPPTAWFVARYSIQLSYARAKMVQLKIFYSAPLCADPCVKKLARAEGFEPPTAWFVARYSIQLSYARAKSIQQIMAEREGFEPSIEL